MSDQTQHFIPLFDKDHLQGVAVGAAADGNPQALSRLPALLPALDEPYRTIADELLRLRGQEPFVDRNVLGGALQGQQLFQVAPNGQQQPLTAGQALCLLPDTPPAEGQLESYLELLGSELARARSDEFRSSAEALIQQHAECPDELVRELQRLADDHRGRGHQAPQEARCELLELLPYMEALESRQRGQAFLGLDSGFCHVNHLCNGLDTGLFVLAAPPGEGKTTLVWQMCCQVAELEQVPVLFVSYEQAKQELRAKALARMSRVEYRHILRGRLRADDQENWPRVLQAASRYARSARHLTILEGDDRVTANTIRNHAVALKAGAGASRCLVAVDYLQILPLDEADAKRVSSTKEKVDLHVSALRRIARDLDSPVIAISSENRAGYRSKALDVFKESGGVEYSADIAAIMTRRRDGSPASGVDYRTEDLNIVKNRNGECGRVEFKFYARRAEFVEEGRGELPGDDEA
jgi:replicative DNA helicase